MYSISNRDHSIKVTSGYVIVFSTNAIRSREICNVNPVTRYSVDAR